MKQVTIFAAVAAALFFAVGAAVATVPTIVLGHPGSLVPLW